MPLTVSIRQQILEYLANTLLPSIVAGAEYNKTPALVSRGWRNPASLGEHQFPALFIVTSSEQRNNITRNQFDSRLRVVIVGYVRDTVGDPALAGTHVQEDMDQMIHDLTKALETDRLQGGLVKWTVVTDIETDDGDLMPVGGFALSVEFQYVTEGTTP